MPPPGTTQCRWGWNWSCCPHVCRTARQPVSAPRCLGSAAISRRVREGGPEEDVEQGALVLQGDGGDLLGEREDQVEVLAREQLVTALLEPRFAGGPLALGAVAVAARAVAETAVAAAVALLDLAAEGGGAAELDGGQDAPLQGGQGHGEAGLEGLAVAAEDVRDFERRAAHRAGRESPPTGCGRGSRSSGLGAEQTLEQAICR